MSPDLIVLILIGVLFACSVYLVLERALTRILLGLMLASNAANLLMMELSGPRNTKGNPAFYHFFSVESMKDPLAQAFCLTSIVISLATGAFIIALAYRSFVTNYTDTISNDSEDSALKDEIRHSSAAADFVDPEDHHSHVGEPAVDRAYSDDKDDPTGDLFEPLNEEDDAPDSDDAVSTVPHQGSEADHDPS